MDLTDLKILIAVVENGGITKAAINLNRVPSGVTSRIIQLEAELDVNLFLRKNKKLLLTPKGEELYRYAKKIINTLDEAEFSMKNEAPGGLFRIGTMESTIISRLQRPLASLHNQYAAIRLELTTGTSRFLYRRLLENKLDAVFIAEPPQDNMTERIPVFEEELAVIAPHDHKAIRTPEDIGEEAFLTFTDGCAYRNRALLWFHAYNMNPGRIITLVSYHAIIGAVAAGMGVGIVPLSVVNIYPLPDLLSVHPVTHSLGKITTDMVWQKSMASANIAALKKIIKNNYPELPN